MYNHSDTEKNRVQVVQLPFIWTSHVIANEQLTQKTGYNHPPYNQTKIV